VKCKFQTEHRGFQDGQFLAKNHEPLLNGKRMYGKELRTACRPEKTVITMISRQIM